MSSPTTTTLIKPANWDEIVGKTYPLTPLDLVVPPAYINLVILFPFADSDVAPSASEVIKSLKDGVARTITQFPHLNGRVMIDPLDGSQKLVIPTKESDIGVRFVERFLTDPNEFPTSYEDLRSAQFPISRFDSKLFSPFENLLQQNGSEGFAIQVTFIRGGVILAPCLHHSLADGPGFDMLMRYLSDNISMTESDSPAIIPNTVLDRSPVLNLTNTDHRPHPEFIILPHEEVWRSAAPPELTNYENRIYSFSTTKLTQLKSAIVASNPTGRVSTNDCLAALLWRCRVQTGLKTGSLKDTDMTLFTMPVNSRSNVPLPDEWFGNAVAVALSHRPVSAFQLDEDSRLNPAIGLGSIALAIRDSLNAIRVEGHVASVCSFINSVPDKRDIFPAFFPLGGPKTGLSSWEGMKTYSYQYGILGLPEKVRVCPSTVYIGAIVVLPKDDSSQKTEFLMALTKEEWQFMHTYILEAGGELVSL